jgi:uncharacterized membrane-anchored protein
MSTLVTRVLIVLGALLIFGGVNYSIAHKENIRRAGEVIYLDLAPVDPRSLMQGDYMTLRFALAAQIERSLEIVDPRLRNEPARGQMNVRDGEVRTADIALDEKKVATFVNAPAAGSMKIRYRIRGYRVWLGTNAFFFEEGRAAQYAKARYGEFRLDRASGEAVLVGLRDEKLNAL